MSGSNEAGDRSQDAGTDPAPPPSAPPSFGKAEPPAAGDETTAGGETDGTEPVPVEIRLPIGLQKPWWADDDEPAVPQAEPEPEPEPVAVQPEESLGTLVAGTGVPNVDTRRAVPNKPIVERPRPASADTDPDGIPVVQPDDVQPEEAEPQATEPQEPETREPDTAEKVLSPDSILPPGTAPPEDSSAAPAGPVAAAAAKPQDDAPDPGAASEQTRPQMIIAPVYHAEGGQSIESPQPPSQNETMPFGIGPLSGGAGAGGGASAGRTSGGRRKPLLIGGGVAVAALLIGIAAFVLTSEDSGSTTRTAGAAGSPSARTGSVPSQTQAPSSAPARPDAPSVIDSARTDRAPLALTEAFPVSRITLGGRLYARDRASVNHQCALVARGAMASALTAQRCTSVVRVTYLDRGRSLAVTSGIAVLPTKAAALRANDAGDPSAYEWFRGMPGKRTADIDRAGGYAASTVRGRYIAYAYATYANGKQPRVGDPTLKTVAEQFVEYALRPIDTRARG
jgi:hypothetical protein